MLLPSSIIERSITKAFVAVTIFTAASWNQGPPADATPLPFVNQYETAADIQRDAFKSHQIIYGRVEKVIDGDTLRMRHLPLYPYLTSGAGSGDTYTGRPSDHTLSIRLYGIDCPETAKRGNPGMYRAEDATELTRQLTQDKVVRVKLLRKDQYNRAVANVEVVDNIKNPMDEEDVSVKLAEEGLATLYTGGGAEYDDKRTLLEQKIATAQKEKRGIWDSTEDLETPAEYKRRIKAQSKQAKEATATATTATIKSGVLL